MPERIVFTEDGDCRGVFSGGNETALELPHPDLEQALSWIKRLNSSITKDGKPVPSLLTVDGFEPWWFVQDHLFTHWLVPLTRYRLAVDWSLRGVPISDPPDELARILNALSEHGVVVHRRRPRRLRALLRTVVASTLEAGLELLSWLSALWFRIRGRSLLFYAIDVVSPGLRNDFRLDPLYRELERRRLGFGEYLHSLGGRTAWLNILRRRRGAVYIRQVVGARRRSVDAIPPGTELQLEDYDGIDRRVWKAIVVHMLAASRQAARQYQTLSRLIALQRPKVALILDDSRHAHALVAACRARGVYVVAYQHGLAFTKYFVGLMCFGFRDARRHRANVYALWSDYFRRRLLRYSRLYDESSVRVCGLLRGPSSGESNGARAVYGATRVQVVSESRGRTAEIVPFVERLLHRDRFEVTLKLRPGETPGEEWAHLLGKLKVSEAGVYEALRDCDVVLGTYGSVLYEAALVLKPLVVVETCSPFGFELGAEGLAEVARSPAEVERVVLRAVRLPPEELERRRAVIWGSATANGAERILDLALHPSN